MFRSLRHRNARIFFVGLLVSNIGTWLQLTATSVLLYRLTGQATTAGLNAAFQFLPMLVIGPWAGGLADRVDRRRLTMVTQAALAAQALVLGGLEIAGQLDVGIIYLLSFVLGVVNALDNPARRGFVPDLVSPEEISNAVSLNTAVMTGSRIFGPALAALLIGPLGPGWLFVGNGLSFVAILASLFFIDTARLYPSPRPAPGGRPVRDAFAHVRTDPHLRTTFVVFTLVSTFGFNYGVVLPKLADVRWGAEWAFGWMLAVVSVGSLAGSLLTARLPAASDRWFYANVSGLGGANLALAWAPNLAVGFAVCVPLGVCGAAMLASMNGLCLARSPDTMRSRMLALTAVAFLGSTPIGGPVTGWVGDTVSIEWSLGYGAVVTLAASAWWWMFGLKETRGVPTRETVMVEAR